MQDHVIAVRIGAEGHVADTAVVGSRELDAFRLELGARSRDVRDAQRDAAEVWGEVDSVALGIPEGERHLAGRHLARVVRIERQPESLVVESSRPLGVARRNGYEVDAFGLHQGKEPSRYGAWRRWSCSVLPSGSEKLARWQTP